MFSAGDETKSPPLTVVGSCVTRQPGKPKWSNLWQGVDGGEPSFNTNRISLRMLAAQGGTAVMVKQDPKYRSVQALNGTLDHVLPQMNVIEIEKTKSNRG